MYSNFLKLISKDNITFLKDIFGNRTIDIDKSSKCK